MIHMRSFRQAAPSGHVRVAAMLAAPLAWQAVTWMAEAPAAGPSPSAVAAWRPAREEADRFGAIVAHNIFLRARDPVVPAAGPEAEPVDDGSAVPADGPGASPDDPDASRVLVGVARRGPADCAFVEDRATGMVTRVEGPGPWPLPSGEIVEIRNDGVVYEAGGRTRFIAVGQPLSGATSRAAVPAPGPPAGPGGAPPADARGGETPETEAILRRLRERRLRE